MAEIVFYLHSSILNPENFKDENVKEFKNKIKLLLEVGRHLKADVFYSKSDIGILSDFFENIDDNFSQSQANTLEVLLLDFKPIDNNSHFFEIEFAGEKSGLKNIKLPYLGNVDIKKHNIILSLNNESICVLLVNTDSSFEKVQISTYSKPEEVWKVITSSLQRNYHFSSKHGNNFKKAIDPSAKKKASQLLCTDTEAQKLLDEAIFDKRKKLKFHYNFDKIKGKYIVFPYEGTNPQNQFHAYHVDEEEWDKEIPSSIRKYFGK